MLIVFLKIINVVFIKLYIVTLMFILRFLIKDARYNNKIVFFLLSSLCHVDVCIVFVSCQLDNLVFVVPVFKVAFWYPYNRSKRQYVKYMKTGQRHMEVTSKQVVLQLRLFFQGKKFHNHWQLLSFNLGIQAAAVF